LRAINIGRATTEKIVAKMALTMMKMNESLKTEKTIKT
jgi:hypothetical protein